MGEDIVNLLDNTIKAFFESVWRQFTETSWDITLFKNAVEGSAVEAVNFISK